jgi:hypothetical protein
MQSGAKPMCLLVLRSHKPHAGQTDVRKTLHLQQRLMITQQIPRSSAA